MESWTDFSLFSQILYLLRVIIKLKRCCIYLMKNCPVAIIIFYYVFQFVISYFSSASGISENVTLDFLCRFILHHYIINMQKQKKTSRVFIILSHTENTHTFFVYHKIFSSLFFFFFFIKHVFKDPIALFLTFYFLFFHFTLTFINLLFICFFLLPLHTETQCCFLIFFFFKQLK